MNPTYEELQAERDDLAAQNNRLKTFISETIKKWRGVPELEPTIWNLQRVLNQQPAACLAQVKADAGRAGFIECLDYLGEYDLETGELFEQDIHAADQYAKRILSGEQP